MQKNTIQEKLFMDACDVNRDGIFRYCYYLVFDRKEAEQLVYEAYHRAWNDIVKNSATQDMVLVIFKAAHAVVEELIHKKNFFPLKKIINNIFSLDFHRDQQKIVHYFPGEKIVTAIKSLDEQYRDVIILKYINHFSVKDIAVILNDSQQHIYQKLQLGFEEIKERDAGLISAFSYHS